MEQERERLAALARRAGRGDEAAFSDLFQATHQRVYYLARQLLGDDAEAMDVAQEAFLKAWKALPKLEHPEAVMTWLFRITDNLCKDRLRKNTEVLLEEAGESLSEQEETDELLLPQELMDRAETRRLVREMIDSLPGPQKECILLYYFAGLSVGEIAAQQECSEGTVKSRLNYARQQIKAAVLTLEKKEGTRLYTLAPLPLLLAFLREVPAEAVPEEAAFRSLWAGLAQEAGLASAGGSTAMAGTAATAGKAAGTALSTKIAAGILAMALVGGGAAGIAALTRRETPPEPVAASTAPLPSQPPSTSSPTPELSEPTPPPLELAIRPVPGENMAGRGFSQTSPTAYPDHTGIDLAAEEGESVVAAQSGLVSMTVWNPTDGKGVVIDHQNGMVTAYVSLASFEVLPQTYVQAGDVIGTVGTYSENADLGSHVHFVVKMDGEFVDPAGYLPD